MIKKFKLKFIFMSAITVFILLVTVITGINLMNYATIRAEADETLEMLPLEYENDLPPNTKEDVDPPQNDKDDSGKPQRPAPVQDDKKDKKGEGKQKDSDHYFILDQRYFYVTYNKDGSIYEIDLNRIGSVNEESALKYSDKALKNSNINDYVGRFRFAKEHIDGGRLRITFLDCGKEFDSYRNSLVSSIIMAIIGFVISCVVIALFSQIIGRPLNVAYKKQKQFITDAGHELKTPLSIINANLDLLESEVEDRESFDEIRNQTLRLKDLTNDLVALARLEETADKMPMVEFPISELVSDTVSSFETVAASLDKSIVCNIAPDLTAKGNQKAIQQLICLLTDNAIKYSPAGDKISVTLKKSGKGCIITLSNISSLPIDSKDTEKLFDRFRRSDASRNSQTGGHGIGLATAKAIVSAHNGKISLNVNENKLFTVTVIL